MKNCKECKHIIATFNDKVYMCELTNDFIEHPWIKPWIKPWICNNYEKEDNVNYCNKNNMCCKQCDNKCSHCCKEVKEEK